LLRAVALNGLFSRCFSHTPLHGYPRWRWLLSVTIQLTSLLACTILSLSTNGPINLEWFGLPWEAYPNPQWLQWYVYVLFGSQVRDLNQWENKLLFAHHIIVIATCLATLKLPAGAGMYLYCSGTLEMGSVFYNLRVLYPNSRIAHVLYAVAMPASNLAACAMGALLPWFPGTVAPATRAFFAVCLFAVCIGREREHLRSIGVLSSKHSHAH